MRYESEIINKMDIITIGKISETYIIDLKKTLTDEKMSKLASQKSFDFSTAIIVILPPDSTFNEELYTQIGNYLFDSILNGSEFSYIFYVHNLKFPASFKKNIEDKHDYISGTGHHLESTNYQAIEIPLTSIKKSVRKVSKKTDPELSSEQTYKKYSQLKNNVPAKMAKKNSEDDLIIVPSHNESIISNTVTLPLNSINISGPWGDITRSLEDLGFTIFELKESHRSTLAQVITFAKNNEPLPLQFINQSNGNNAEILCFILLNSNKLPENILTEFKYYLYSEENCIRFVKDYSIDICSENNVTSVLSAQIRNFCNDNNLPNGKKDIDSIIIKSKNMVANPKKLDRKASALTTGPESSSELIYGRLLQFKNNIFNIKSKAKPVSNPINKQSMHSIYQKANTDNQLSRACASLNSALKKIVTEGEFSKLQIQIRELSALRLFSANSEGLEKQSKCISLLIQKIINLPSSLEMSELKSTTINLLVNMESRVKEVIKQINNFNSGSTSKDVERLDALLKQRPLIVESEKSIDGIISNVGVLKLANYLNKSLFLNEGNVNMQNNCKKLADKLLDALIDGDKPQLTDMETNLLKKSNILKQIYDYDILPSLNSKIDNTTTSNTLGRY